MRTGDLNKAYALRTVVGGKKYQIRAHVLNKRLIHTFANKILFCG